MARLVDKVAAVAGAGIIAGTVGAVSAELVGQEQHLDLNNISLQNLLEIVKDPLSYSNLINALIKGEYKGLGKEVKYKLVDKAHLDESIELNSSDTTKPHLTPEQNRLLLNHIMQGTLRINNIETRRLSKYEVNRFLESIYPYFGYSQNYLKQDMIPQLSEDDELSYDVSITNGKVTAMSVTIKTGNVNVTFTDNKEGTLSRFSLKFSTTKRSEDKFMKYLEGYSDSNTYLENESNKIFNPITFVEVRDSQDRYSYGTFQPPNNQTSTAQKEQ